MTGVVRVPTAPGSRPSDQAPAGLAASRFDPSRGTFAERLECARQASSLTYGALAERAGISKTHVWELARGRVANPTITLTEKLSDALGCEPAWLAGWDTVDAALDRMGWPEIHAFQAELRRGQDVYEDAGGFMLRSIKALFGIRPRDPVVSYREAAAAMIAQAMSAGTAETPKVAQGDSPPARSEGCAHPQPVGSETATDAAKREGEA